MGWNRNKEQLLDNDPQDPLFLAPYMTAKKNTFINIIKNPIFDNGEHFGTVLIDAIDRTNKIVFHVYNFLKLYILYSFDNNLKCPSIDKNFIKNIICTITARTETRGKKPSEDSLITITSLKKFYEIHYKPFLLKEEMISDHKLSYILNYEQVDIVKNIETNIKEHYSDHIRHFVNIYFDLDGSIKKINNEKISGDDKKEKIRLLRERMNKVKNDLFKIPGEEWESDDTFHEWINKYKKLFIPYKLKYEKDSVLYDVCVYPQDYIYSLIRLNREIDHRNQEIIKNHKLDHENKFDNLSEKYIPTHPKIHKLFHVLPLRTQIIPKYITLDTASLISLFMKDNSAYNLKHMKQLEDKIWNKFFIMKNKVFKKSGHKFHHMIKTNGVACSVLFIKTDPNGISYKPINKSLNEIFKEQSRIKYIEEVPITESMRSKRIITIDPGKNDLISCMAIVDPSMVGQEYLWENDKGELCNKVYKDVVKFRYTQRQRNHDTRKHKYTVIRQNLRKELIEGKSINTIESVLSKYDSKTTDFNKFKEHILVKILVNSKLHSYYNKTIHRKLKWNTYINTRRSEDTMLNNFEKKFGNYQESLIVLGDYSEKNHKKGNEPTVTKHLRKLFKDKLYELYLIDEFRTSKLCHKCEHETENFLKVKRITKKGVVKDLELWKLIRCKASNCLSIHNRDENATRNMMKITKAVMEGKQRPEKYKRKDPQPETQPLKKLRKKSLVRKKAKEIIII